MSNQENIHPETTLDLSGQPKPYKTGPIQHLSDHKENMNFELEGIHIIRFLDKDGAEHPNLVNY